MKNRHSVFLLILFILISMSCSRTVSDTKKIDAKINRAIGSWADPKLFDSCIVEMPSEMNND